MKRQELLKQMDQELDVQRKVAEINQRALGESRKKLDELARRIQEFKEEENKRVPKWAKPKKWEHENCFSSKRWHKILLSKFYQLSENKHWGYTFFAEAKSGNQLYCREHQDYAFGVQEWELCYDDNPPEYDDNPPEEKKTVRILEGKEKIAADDIIVWNGHLVSIVENTADIPVYSLAGYPITIAIRIEKE